MFLLDGEHSGLRVKNTPRFLTLLDDTPFTVQESHSLAKSTEIPALAYPLPLIPIR